MQRESDRSNHAFSTYLSGTPWSEEFMRQYARALDGEKAQTIGAERSVPGSVAALVAAYLDSVPFRTRAPATQRTRRSILDRFREQQAFDRQ